MKIVAAKGIKTTIYEIRALDGKGLIFFLDLPAR